MAPFVKHLFLTTILVSLIGISFPCLVHAQDNNFDDESSFQPQKGHPGYFAAGSFFIQSFSPDLSPFNDKIKTMGIPVLDPTLMQYGFHAFGSLQKKWRIGIFYYQGGTSTAGIVYDTIGTTTTLDSYEKSVKLYIKGVGVSGGYRITLPKSFEIEPSLWLGVAFIDANISQTNAYILWDDVWHVSRQHSETIQQSMSSYYTYAQPGINIRYYARSWIAVSIGAQYMIPITKADTWTLAAYRVKNAKTFDPTSINGIFMVSVGI